MAEEEKKDGEEAQKAPAKSKKMMIIIIAVVVLIALLGGGAAFYFMSKKGVATEEADSDAAGDTEPEDLPEGAGEAEELAEGEEGSGAFFPLDTFVVNLTGGKFARIQMQLEFIERDIPKRFYAKMVPIRDALIVLLTQKTEGDLATAEGKRILKDQIRDIINDQLKKEEVGQVYFTQFVIQ